MSEAAFEVTVDSEAARAFAALSGDWNPLHTDEAYAAGTQFGRTILHGWSAELLGSAEVKRIFLGDFAY